MHIAIIGGTGKEGRAIAHRWLLAGHDIALGSRDAERGKATAKELVALGLKGNVEGGDNLWAAQQAELALLAIPYAAHHTTLTELKEALRGKILIDITVPLKPPQVRTVHLPAGQSAALEAQALLGSEVRVVATLHHVSSTHLADTEHPLPCDILTCSDDSAALDLVLKLLNDLGAQAFDAGPLQNSIALESLTPVLLHLGRRYKSPGMGIRLTQD